MSGRVPPERAVVLGRVSGLFGVGGWIKVYSYTRPVESIFDYADWWLGPRSGRTHFRLLEGRPQGKTLVARLADESGRPIVDRDAAAEWLETDIAVDRRDMPEPAPGEYYWCDLIGLRVETADNVPLGRVSALMETGANDVLVVDGERERLIPMLVPRFVKSVDLHAEVIVVDWDPAF